MNKFARYKVRVTKDHLVFSAAHFITFNGNICERLHGHNWRVAAELTGPLDENGYVFDFIALRDQLQKTVDALDHRVLLPTQHRQIKVSEQNGEVEATFDDRRWVFPREDCILLPIENTTAELIAHWIGQQLLTVIGSNTENQIESIQIEVEENFGQWAICKLPVS
ncbi:6-pyruvoyl tetrahydropterin synthase family protein [Gimesia sp.]|uniref:6-pyruvoyl trahydropterin synthase family protein n=1 Tax=Gimesia sp. TaxID=2024833 RepID=UPI000C3D8E48|nr:6-pyruvoyl tetrahydropterin synthase family protein [Gimesia sp.]MAX39138.1 6-pyruvoyl tetrahydrobiopterin synthase [Gimesia sp.]HAH43957.1 6-pyruvoyl tetrahydrobiopterin synthase [Planctomycetaceae bacterium]HBL45235.1 6-pyruvoyl tetrahydrobiopterin synthase [Planctomycetaceae bacterium]|tara:strand:+ start:6563 stop:7060 length:498 start_codon:yes stop_codon:yes gene_type:complete